MSSNETDIREESILSENEVQTLLSDVIQRENITNPSFNIASGASKGDGYTSFLTRVSIKSDNKNDLNLIIKCAPKNAEMREVLLSRETFVREVYLYDQVFPAFQKFQLERNVKEPFEAVAKYYKSDDAEFKELIVFENLIESGFGLFDKRKQMDHDHLALVLREYGKYHAVSFAMKEHSEDIFGKLRDNLRMNTINTKSFSANLTHMFTDPADKLIGLFDEETEKALCNYILGFKDEIIPFLDTTSEYFGKYGVITHGDCWCNNMMFKYEDQNNAALPTSVRFFDFQIASYNSPVLDVSYFFYVSASKEMLDHLDDYLKIYHDSLTENMKAMNTNVEDHFPFSALKQEWKTYSKYALILALIIFRVMLREDEETLDFTDVKDGVPFADMLLNKSKNDDLINHKYRTLVRHMYYKGFL